MRQGEPKADEAVPTEPPGRMTEGVEGEGQTPSRRNRHSQGVSTVLWRDCGDATSGPEEETLTPESGVEHADSEEQNEDEEQEPASCPTAPGTDGGQVGGLTGRSRVVAPDGGWGWVVLVATILVLALTLAFPACIGIFYIDLQTEFNTSNTETSWVPAIMIAMLHAGGPICSVLVERFGCRVTMMGGGFLSGLGIAVSALARTITELYITSAIAGLGFCFSLQPSVTMMGHYFVRRRAFANALSSTGTALGLSILPLIANFLLTQFGWRGSFLVLGGLLLNCCVCGAVMRPLGPTSGPNRPEHLQASSKPKTLKDDRIRTVLFGFVAFLRRHMAFDLLVSNARYRAYAVGVTWMMLGFAVPLVYLVPYATHYNIEQDRTALLMSILGLVNIAVRPVAALLFGLPRFRGSGFFVYVFAAAVLVNGLSDAIAGASASFEVLLLYVVIYGLSMSVIGSLLVTVLMEMVEMSRFPSALGLISMLESGTLLIGPPLAGMLVDSTGHYSYVFYACCVSVSSSGLFLMGSFYFLDSKRDGEKKKKKRMKKPSGLYQKPAVMLVPECEHSHVPSQGRKAKHTVYVTNV